MTGYTVVDFETTGLFPQKHDRVVEVGLVSVSDSGAVEAEWSTLINPERDVGPTDIHGITAREVLAAPTFRDVAPHLVDALTGRTLVAHNARFDTRFLDHELERAGVGTRPPTPSLCTMQMSSSFLTGASRKLKDCCAAARVDLEDAHTALGDARATAGLLRHFLSRSGVPVPWSETLQTTRSHWWPTVAVDRSTLRPVDRSAALTRPDAWLDRISSRLPRSPDPQIESYLDVLERAMLDGYLSAHEEAALVQVAEDLGLHRDQVMAVHATFLDSMAIAAWADGVVTDAERSDLAHVAQMLGLPRDLVRLCLRRAERLSPGQGGGTGFHLQRGDQIVLTGTMSLPRDQLVVMAEQAGLRHGSVTKTTRAVVAADPDSLSGKAAKARSYGIPVITEAAFARLLADMR